MAVGFVYLLGNQSMPDVYKIGCTERSPSRRAAELSAATGVPMQFDVICYWEGENFQQYERVLHEGYAECRVNDCREFFRTSLLYEFVNEVERRWLDERHSFCITDIGRWYLEEDEKRGPR